MTLAPSATAYWIAVIASDVYPPAGFRNLSGMMRALPATPATPSALPRSGGDGARDVRAVAVAVGRVVDLGAPSRRSPSRGRRQRSRWSRRRCPLPAISPGLCHRRPARSGWDTSTPVSMTATVTGAAPPTASQPAGASMPGSGPLRAEVGSSGDLQRLHAAVELHGVGGRDAGEQVARLGERDGVRQVVGRPAGHQVARARRRRGPRRLPARAAGAGVGIHPHQHGVAARGRPARRRRSTRGAEREDRERPGGGGRAGRPTGQRPGS